jgi:flagellar biosynthesis/type III secretory pathway M-ring protein FliF/YscJ
MPNKQYPPFFEKAVPVALVFLGLLVLALLVVIGIVLFGN